MSKQNFNFCYFCTKFTFIGWQLIGVVNNYKSNSQQSFDIKVCEDCLDEQTQLQELGKQLKGYA